ncbi:MAG TPA: MFS transporter [Frankiaceae bacterium]|nr:MFS transporter [Frankiaceae bacterium]
MLTLLRRHADLRRLAAAGLVSMSGDYLLFVGLSYLVYDLTGSTVAAGGALLANFAPQVRVGSFAGVMVDRCDRRRTMVLSDVLQAVGLLPLLWAGEGRIWVVYAVLLWQGTVEQFFHPAQQALVPSLVPEEDLLAANAVTGQSQHLARLAGSAAGGVVAAWGGIAAVALADAGTFVVSALLLSRIVARPAPRSEVAVETAVRRLTAEWRSGLRLIGRTRGLRVVLVFGLLTGVGEGVLGTLLAPWVRDVVHGDGRAYGLLVGLQAIGGVAGAALVTPVGRRVAAARMFGWGAVGLGLVDFVLLGYPVLWPDVLPSFVLIVVGGVPAALCFAGYVTVVQKLTSDEYRGRVVGAFMAARGLAMLAGIGLAASLGETVGILPMVMTQAAVYTLGGAFVLISRIDHS